MVSVGLDISTCTGLAVIGNGLEMGKAIEFPKMRGMARLQYIQQETYRVLNNWKPDLAVVEMYAHHHNVSSFIKVVECGTVIRQVLHTLQIPWVTVPTTSLKMWTTGYGAGKKERMALSVKERWGFSSPSDDIVDAYALAQMGQLGLDAILSIKGVALGH